MKKIIVFIIMITNMISCYKKKENTTTSTENKTTLNEKVYYGGDIITMDGDTPSYVEAIVEHEGKIIFVGSKADALTKFKEKADTIDLKGKTMLPGFIDSHGHFMSALQMVNQVNVASPPVGTVTDIPSLIEILKNFKKERNIKDGEWIIGWGYDNDQLKEKRHVLKTDLDTVFPNNKVMIIHVSMHGAVLNSKALEWAKIDANTPTPDGGIIARMEGSNEPAGLIMENAYLPVFENLPKPTEEELLELMKPAQMMYAQEGYTHAQEGFTSLSDIDFLQKAAEKGKMFLDIVSLPGFPDFDQWLNNPKYKMGSYENHLKLQGLKITQDGSPQGKTAHVSHPYLTGGPAGQKNWTGESTLPNNQFKALIKKALDNHIQLFVHANGDATIDQLIEAIHDAKITAKDDRRTVAIHSQFQRPEQLPKYAELGITPSYFTNHCFFWGDAHIKNIGENAANFISPVESATNHGLIYSNHTDFNVTPLDPFFVMWTAMARESRSGKTIGKEEQINAYKALQGLTTGPAYQLFEENRKGKLKEGLLADFIILDKNPIKEGVTGIKNIQVLETIKEGKTIYKR